MNYSKAIITLMFIVIGLPNIVAQNTLSINGIKANGEYVVKNDVFLLNDACTFYVQDENGEKQELQSSKWQLLCKDKNGNDVVEREVKEQKEFHFLLDDFRTETSELRQVNSDTDRSVYFEAYINCTGNLKNGQSFDISFPIYLNLLPTKPLCEIVKRESNEIYIDLDITCKSERGETLTFIIAEHYGIHVYTLIYPIENFSKTNFSIMTELDSVIYDVSSRNKYGVVEIGRTKMPEYIISSVDNLETDNSISFYPNPFQNEINISGDINQVKSLCIYDINGRMVKQISHPQSNVIPTEDLSAGVYIVNIELINNLGYKKHKLIKK